MYLSPRAVSVYWFGGKGELSFSMNLPPGNPLKLGLDMAAVDFLGLVRELGRMKFNGYLCATISAGEMGIEEGTLIFDDGKPVASAYEYFGLRKLLLGADAFKRVLNASAAKIGIVDVFELTNEQVHLVLAFTEAAIYVPTDAELANVPREFSYELGGSLRAQQLGPSRDQLLKKYRLGGITAEEAKAGLQRMAPQEEDLLKKLAEETVKEKELRERIKPV